MQQRTHAWPISRLHSGEQTDDREGRRRQSDALSVTAMRAGGASFLCAAPHCSLGAALGCVHERWRRAHGEWGWEKKKRQLVQRSAAQRSAQRAKSASTTSTPQRHKRGTQAHRTSVDGFQLKERRCDVLPA